MKKLLTAFILMGVGLAFCTFAAITGYLGGSNPEEISAYTFVGIVCLLVGAAFLISYFISRKFLAEELGLEDKSGEAEPARPKKATTRGRTARNSPQQRKRRTDSWSAGNSYLTWNVSRRT